MFNQKLYSLLLEDREEQLQRVYEEYDKLQQELERGTSYGVNNFLNL